MIITYIRLCFIYRLLQLHELSLKLVLAVLQPLCLSFQACHCFFHFCSLLLSILAEFLFPNGKLSDLTLVLLRYMLQLIQLHTAHHILQGTCHDLRINPFSSKPSNEDNCQDISQNKVHLHKTVVSQVRVLQSHILHYTNPESIYNLHKMLKHVLKFYDIRSWQNLSHLLSTLIDRKKVTVEEFEIKL